VDHQVELPRGDLQALHPVLERGELAHQSVILRAEPLGGIGPGAIARPALGALLETSADLEPGAQPAPVQGPRPLGVPMQAPRLAPKAFGGLRVEAVNLNDAGAIGGLGHAQSSGRY
jgi:hypothetical protein